VVLDLVLRPPGHLGGDGLPAVAEAPVRGHEPALVVVREGAEADAGADVVQPPLAALLPRAPDCGGRGAGTAPPVGPGRPGGGGAWGGPTGRGGRGEGGDGGPGGRGTARAGALRGPPALGGPGRRICARLQRGAIPAGPLAQTVGDFRPVPLAVLLHAPAGAGAAAGGVRRSGGGRAGGGRARGAAGPAGWGARRPGGRRPRGAPGESNRHLLSWASSCSVHVLEANSTSSIGTPLRRVWWIIAGGAGCGARPVAPGAGEKGGRCCRGRGRGEGDRGAVLGPRGDGVRRRARFLREYGPGAAEEGPRPPAGPSPAGQTAAPQRGPRGFRTGRNSTRPRPRTRDRGRAPRTGPRRGHRLT